MHFGGWGAPVCHWWIAVEKKRPSPRKSQAKEPGCGLELKYMELEETLKMLTQVLDGRKPTLE